MDRILVNMILRKRNTEIIDTQRCTSIISFYLYKLSVTYVSIQTSVFRDGKVEG